MRSRWLEYHVVLALVYCIILIAALNMRATALANDEGMPIYVCRIEDIDKINTHDIVGTFVHAKKK